MTVRDIIVCFLAFLPTGWGMLLVSKITVHSTSFTALSTEITNMQYCFRLLKLVEV